MNYTIRKVEQNDVSTILRAGINIVDQYERTHLGDETVDGYINSGACERDYLAQLDDMLILESEDTFIGMIIWSENEIKGLFIDIPFWGTGSAEYLVSETLKSKRKDFTRITLECFESSPRANSFYKKLGFLPIGFTNDDMPTRIIYELNI